MVPKLTTQLLKLSITRIRNGLRLKPALGKTLITSLFISGKTYFAIGNLLFKHRVCGFYKFSETKKQEIEILYKKVINAIYKNKL